MGTEKVSNGQSSPEDQKQRFFQSVTRGIEEDLACAKARWTARVAQDPDPKKFPRRTGEYLLECFDIQAHWTVHAVWDRNRISSFYEPYLEELRATIAKSGAFLSAKWSPPFNRQRFLSMLRLNLSARVEHWKAEALKRVRQMDQAATAKNTVSNPQPAKKWEGAQESDTEIVDAKLPAVAEDGTAPHSLETFNDKTAAKEARAITVAKLIKELNLLKPQMFEDESEYNRLLARYPDFLTFKIAEQRPDLKSKVLAIQGSTRHVRLAQELAGARHGRELSTIQDDWKDFKPSEFKRPK